MGDSLLRPYTLPPWLGSDKYLVPLQEVLSELLIDVPESIWRRICFHQDGAPSHYGRSVRDHLDWTFPNRWIGHGGLPDLLIYLLSLFFLLGAMTAVSSETDLVARKSIAAAAIHETAGIFKHVWQSTSRRYRACMNSNDHNFKQLPWCFCVILLIYYSFFCLIKHFTLILVNILLVNILLVNETILTWFVLIILILRALLF